MDGNETVTVNDTPTLIKNVPFDQITSILNLLLSALLVFALIFLMWRRKVIINSTGALVPEKWGDLLDKNSTNINQLGNAVINNFEDAFKELSEQKSKVLYSQENITALTKEIKKLSDIIIDFKETIDLKDKEIDRLRNGYDVKIYKNFLVRVVSLYETLEGTATKVQSTLEKNEVSNIMTIFQGFLNDVDVEAFAPEIGSDFSKTGNSVGDSPLLIDTDDSSKNLHIADIISKGYKLRNTEEDVILIPAQVSIYKFNRSD